MPDFAQRVSRGAKLLDAMQPGWAKRIGCDPLAMDSCTDCILGQVFGHYTIGKQKLGISLFPGSYYGFDLSSEDIDSNDLDDDDLLYTVLADLWRAEIVQRLTQGVTC